MSKAFSADVISPDNLPSEHYIIAVRHPFPDVKQLQNEFASSRGYVAKTYDGRPWEKHPRCRDVPEKNYGRIMRLVWFDSPMTSEAVLAHVSERYRPATHTELLAFARTHPMFQLRYWIVALGSTTFDDPFRHVAVLEGDQGGRRILETYPLHSRWMPRRRFLFVYE